MITVTLPYPPTVNTYWRTVMIGKAPRTLISAKGRQYKQDVAHACASEGCAGARVKGRLAVTLTAYPPDRRLRDLDNLTKAPLDALTNAGVWLDDAQIDRLVVERGAVVSGGKLEVCVEVLQ